MKRFFASVGIFLALGFSSAWGVLPSPTPSIILDQVATSEQQQLNLVIPPDTSIGFHTITVQVSDAHGVITSRDIAFCKDLDLSIHWNNLCPDLLHPSTVSPVVPTQKVVIYDPSQDTKHVTGILIAALALLSVLSSSPAGKSQKPEKDDDEGSLEGISHGVIKGHDRGPGWGDVEETWKFPFTARFDRIFLGGAKRSSRFSPLHSRIVSDGAYLRAIAGSASLVFYPFGLWLGLQALHENQWQAAPTSLGVMIAGVLLGVIDACAGFIAAVTFIAGIVIKGQFTSIHHILVTLGVSLLWFAPALIASGLRPMRREIKNGASFWERATDYALVVLLTGWAAQNMIEALGGLSGYRYPIMSDATVIAVVAACAILTRMILEECVTYSYPVRFNALIAEKVEPGSWHGYWSATIKVILFFLVSLPFIGNSLELWLGAILFALPIVITFFDEHFPKSKSLQKYLPKGTVKTIATILIGAVFAKILQSHFSNGHEYLRVAFVILGLPTMLFGFVYNFAEGEANFDWERSRLRTVSYRVLGLGIYLLLALYVHGTNIAAPVERLLGLK